MDYVASKHMIQTVRYLWKAKHIHKVNFYGLIPSGSQEMCENLTNVWVIEKGARIQNVWVIEKIIG